MTSLNLVHRVHVPDSAAGERFSAVVMVHGWLGNENVMSIFERTLPPGVVIVSPRAPYAGNENGYGWYPGDNEADAAGEGLEALAQFVRALPQSYPVDPERVLLMGFSQGAALCYLLALRSPDQVLGVAGLAGFLPEAARPWLTPGRLEGKPIFIAHGTEDETVPVARARQARAALQAAGAQVSYHEYPVGHKMTTRGMSDLKAWLAEQLPLA